MSVMSLRTWRDGGKRSRRAAIVAADEVEVVVAPSLFLAALSGDAFWFFYSMIDGVVVQPDIPLMTGNPPESSILLG